MRMGLCEANQKFSKAMREVKAGRQVVLTDRGTPIAIIQPLALPSSDQAALKNMREAGILRAAKVRKPMPPWRPVRLNGPAITKTLRAERDER